MRAAGALGLLALLPATALANGAFPDTAQVLLPADRPQTILLGTNFGLVISDDGGGRWRWTCEHGDGNGGYRYTLSADQKRLVGLAGRAIIASQDLGCTWTSLASDKETIPFDFFPDAADPALAYVLVETLQTRIDAITRLDLRQPAAPPQVLYAAPMDEQLTTVEVARSDARIVYATLNPADGSGRTRMVRSMDGGSGWVVAPIEAPADSVDLRIAAVDPKDARKIFFRAGTPQGQGEGLLVSEDGGGTARRLFATDGALAAFFPRSDGGALLATLELGVGKLYRWDGAAFVAVPARMGVRGFAERAGVIYAATDNAADGFAVARSRDGGGTWERVMGFGDISAISACGELPGVCAASCAMLAMRGAVKGELCAAPVVPDAAVDAAAMPPKASGCSCRLGRSTSTSTSTRLERRAQLGSPLFNLVLVLVLVLVLRVRRSPAAHHPSRIAAAPAAPRTGNRE